MTSSGSFRFFSMVRHGNKRRRLEHVAIGARQPRLLGAHAIDQKRARRRLLQIGDHAQHGGLAAAGRTDEGNELALGDLQADVRQRSTLPSAVSNVRETSADIDRQALRHRRPVRPWLPLRVMRTGSARVTNDRSPVRMQRSVVIDQVSMTVRYRQRHGPILANVGAIGAPNVCAMQGKFMGESDHRRRTCRHRNFRWSETRRDF